MKEKVSTMRIEDACAWRKAFSERQDETATILVEALRRISVLKINRVLNRTQLPERLTDAEVGVAQTIAREALIEAGLNDPYEDQ